MINIAEILDKCTKGTKLYSPIFGDVYLEKIRPHLAVIVNRNKDEKNLEEFLYDGRYTLNGECMLFPSKENRDWNTFLTFKDGDILTYTGNRTTTFIYRNKDNEPQLSTSFYVACNDAPSHNFLIYNKYTLIALNENCDVRLATEDEKIKLFDAIKANGYKWNAETKTLEKLIVPKFKVGDQIVKKNSISNSFIVNSISCEYYGLQLPDKSGVGVLNVNEQDDWEVLPQYFFNNGDIIAKDDFIVIFSHSKQSEVKVKEQIVYYHCYLRGSGYFKSTKGCGVGYISDFRFATNEEKQKLFDAIKENCYKWNPETKALEKLIEPKFKSGDKIVNKNNLKECWYVQGVDTNCNSGYFYYIVAKGKIANLHFKDQDEWELLVITPKFKVGDKVKHIHTGVYCHIKAYADELKGYYTSIGHFIKDDNVDEWEIIPNKFDISTLKAFDKVLVRDSNESRWCADMFSHYSGHDRFPFCPLGSPLSGFSQCIPYEGNEHLIGTTNDCDEYYKNW